MVQQTVCDLFICYAPADEAWVQGYLIPALGLPPERVLTRELFRLGAPTADEFERAVTESRYTLLVISQAYIVDEWTTFAAKLASFLSVDEEHDRLIPLWREHFAVPPQLRFRESLDCSDPTKWDAAVQRLLTQLGAPEPDHEYVPCPYPGMVPFTPEQAQFFYGRDDEIMQLIRRVRDEPLVFVIGPSGSGKSSLVFAGLLPQLTGGKHFPTHFWRVRHMRPAAQPTKTLQDLLDQEQPQQGERAVGSPVTSPSPQRLFVVIDQFEELFTQHELAEQTRFFQTLEEHRALRDSTVLFTMRADFYAALMSSAWWDIASKHRFEITPLRGKALREAIQRPAAEAGVYLERDLLESLRRDAADAPGSLPLIQETMRRLWDRRHRRLLTLRAYEEMGRDEQSGLVVAVASKADDTLHELTPTQQETARRIFVSLVRVSEGCPDTRRQQPLNELRDNSNDPHTFDTTLEHLIDNRLLTVSSGDQDQGPLVDLSHEALITGWPKLQTWLLKDRANVLLHGQLEEDADAWDRSRRDASFLYGGSRLAEAQRYAHQYPDEPSPTLRGFLAASAARERVRERSRYLGQAAGGAVGAALGYGLAFALAAWYNRNFRADGDTISFVILAFVSMFVIGALVGFGTGVALWLCHRNPVRRLLAAGLSATLLSSLGVVLYFRLFLNNAQYLQALAVGAVLGAGIGTGAGLDRRQRVIGTVLGGTIGMALASLPLHWSLLLSIGAGVLLGAFAAFGFEATAVEHDEYVIA
jgi:energy-coupling factor transporter ATP-binding protein EcfA2